MVAEDSAKPPQCFITYMTEFKNNFETFITDLLDHKNLNENDTSSFIKKISSEFHKEMDKCLYRATNAPESHLGEADEKMDEDQVDERVDEQQEDKNEENTTIFHEKNKENAEDPVVKVEDSVAKGDEDSKVPDEEKNSIIQQEIDENNFKIENKIQDIFEEFTEPQELDIADDQFRDVDSISELSEPPINESTDATKESQETDVTLRPDCPVEAEETERNVESEEETADELEEKLQPLDIDQETLDVFSCKFEPSVEIISNNSDVTVDNSEVENSADALEKTEDSVENLENESTLVAKDADEKNSENVPIDNQEDSNPGVSDSAPSESSPTDEEDLNKNDPELPEDKNVQAEILQYKNTEFAEVEEEESLVVVNSKQETSENVPEEIETPRKEENKNPEQSEFFLEIKQQSFEENAEPGDTIDNEEVPAASEEKKTEEIINFSTEASQSGPEEIQIKVESFEKNLDDEEGPAAEEEKINSVELQPVLESVDEPSREATTLQVDETITTDQEQVPVAPEDEQQILEVEEIILECKNKKEANEESFEKNLDVEEESAPEEEKINSAELQPVPESVDEPSREETTLQVEETITIDQEQILDAPEDEKILQGEEIIPECKNEEKNFENNLMDDEEESAVEEEKINSAELQPVLGSVDEPSRKETITTDQEQVPDASENKQQILEVEEIILECQNEENELAVGEDSPEKTVDISVVENDPENSVAPLEDSADCQEKCLDETPGEEAADTSQEVEELDEEKKKEKVEAVDGEKNKKEEISTDEEKGSTEAAEQHDKENSSENSTTNIIPEDLSENIKTNDLIEEIQGLKAEENKNVKKTEELIVPVADNRDKVVEKIVIEPEEAKSKEPPLKRVLYLLKKFVKDDYYSQLNLIDDIKKMKIQDRSSAMNVVDAIFTEAKKIPKLGFSFACTLRNFADHHRSFFNTEMKVTSRCEHALRNHWLDKISDVQLVCGLYQQQLVPIAFIHKYIQYFFQRKSLGDVEALCLLVKLFDREELLKTTYIEKLRTYLAFEGISKTRVNLIHNSLLRSKKWQDSW